MIIKLTALIMSLCVALLFLLGLRNPTDVLFLFVSYNQAMTVIRVLVMALFVLLVIRSRFTYWETRVFYGVLGITLVGLSMVGILVESIDYRFIATIKPLDYLFFMGSGMMLAFLSLHYEHSRKFFSRPPLRQRQMQLKISTAPR